MVALSRPRILFSSSQCNVRSSCSFHRGSICILLCMQKEEEGEVVVLEASVAAEEEGEDGEEG